MKRNISITFITRKAAMLSAIFFIVLQGCKKDGELYPDFNKDNLNTFVIDSLTIETELQLDDSIQTDFASLNLLGLYHDSVFGYNSASFYSQITLSGVNINFGNNPVVDSIVLSLAYESALGYYGNLNTPMDIEVYRLSEDMDKDDYYSYDEVDYSGYPTPLASLSFSPFVNDSVEIIDGNDTIMVAPQIRLRLDDAFGQEILNAGGNSNTIETNSDLLDVVKGIYVTPTTDVTNSSLAMGEGSILYFNVNSSASTVQLYYHNDTDTTSYTFIMNSESKKFNRFEHNYAGTNIENQLNNVAHDSTLTYVQAMSGLRTKINIPYLKNLASIENIVINKAELEFTVAEGSHETYDVIESPVLTGINDENKATFLVDYFEGTDFFGGTFDSETGKYTFNISRHIQNILNNPDEVDNGLYLMATSSATSSNRSVINNVKHPNSKIKLTITYSKP